MTPAVSAALRAAVDASLSWYDALCALHGVPCGIEDDLWRCYAAPPPLHSAVKTVEPSARADRALRAMDAHEHGSIADSFGSFDLTAEGFDLLFDAQWIHRPPANLPTRQLPADWVVLTTAPELQRWTAQHDTSQVLLPALLERSSFRVLGRVQGAAYSAGVVLRLGSGVVDVSNLWAVEPGSEWPEVVAAAAALFPDRPLVGYESGADLGGAQQAGFTTVGPQRVWVR